MTIAWSPICLNAAYEPRANPAFTGTPFTVTLRSVRGMPMRKTSPACICPVFPRACSTAFQSGSAAAAGTASATRTPNPTTAYWICCSLRSLITAAPSSRVRLMQAPGVRPVEVVHERVDIFRGGRAVVDVVGVLVHIERQDRRASRHAVGVVGRPLVYELAVAMGIGEKHPAGAAAHGFRHREELCSPSILTSEVSRSASRNAVSGAPPSPSPSKYSSCRIIEFVAISSSRFSPLITNTGAVAKSTTRADLSWEHDDLAGHRRPVNGTLQAVGADLSRLEKCGVLAPTVPCRFRDDALAVWVGELDLVMIAVRDEHAQHDGVVLLHGHERRTELVRRHLPAFSRCRIGLAGPLVRIPVIQLCRVDLGRRELVGCRGSFELDRRHIDRVRVGWRPLCARVAGAERRAHYERAGDGRSHQPPPVTPRMVRSSKAVIESALVHSPTRPSLKRVSRCSR